MTSTCNKGFIPFLDVDALCGSERRQPPFGQTIKADLTLNLRPLIGKPWHSTIYRILSRIVVKYNSRSSSCWTFRHCGDVENSQPSGRASPEESPPKVI